MTKATKKRATSKRTPEKAASLFDDRLLAFLVPRIVTVAKHAAIWAVRLAAMLLLPVRLVAVVTLKAVRGFVQGGWCEVQIVRGEKRSKE